MISAAMMCSLLGRMKAMVKLNNVSAMSALCIGHVSALHLGEKVTWKESIIAESRSMSV